MTFFDFFSGIGGFRLGFEMAGHKCVGFCEYDKFAVRSYRAIHDAEEEVFFNDIRTIDPADIPRADIWTAGFPCQDISVAGKQGGIRADRSGLFFAVTTLLAALKEEARPQYVVFENVRNLFSVGRGWDFARVLVELANIGYACEWQVIDSKGYVPQHRERAYIIGHLGGFGGREVFPITGSYCAVTGVQGQHANALRASDKSGAEGGTFIVEERQLTQERRIKQIGTRVKAGGTVSLPHRVYDPSGIAPTLVGMGGGNHEPKIIQAILTPDRPTKRQAGRRMKDAGEPMFTLTAQDRHGVVIGGVYTNVSESHNRGVLPKLSRTLKADGHPAGAVIYNGIGYRIRKLTPKEYFRLQGFPDDCYDRAAAVNSSSQLYKQAGNAVSVPVIYEIARRIRNERDS